MAAWRFTVVILLSLGSSVSGTPARAEGLVAAKRVTIPAGTRVALELLQHVNSNRQPAGSKVYARVVGDVVVDGILAIPAGTVVTGRISDASGPKYLGHGGWIGVEVTSVSAPDGSQIPVRGYMEREGRDRTAAAVASTEEWGPLGLLTRGGHAFIEKGEVFEVSVRADREITVGAFGAPEVPPEPEGTLRTRLVPRDRKVSVDLSQGKTDERLQFYFELPLGVGAGDIAFETLELVRVDDVDLPEPVKVTEIDPKVRRLPGAASKAKVVTFDAWSVLRYCGSGHVDLTFRVATRDGTSISGSAGLETSLKAR